MKTYRLTTAGRRTTIILMLGAILLWVFAFLTLPSTLGIRYLALLSTLRAAIAEGLGPGRLIPAGILIMMLVAAPLLMWGLWEEWSTSYTVAEDGLTYRTRAGIALHYPWGAIRALRQDGADDSVADLIVQTDATGQIRNPILRWLHRQAIGARRVPIYADVESRDELVAEILQRSGLAVELAQEPAGASSPALSGPPATHSERTFVAESDRV